MLDEEPLMNGHVDENVSTEISSRNDTKVVTKTTTVTETQVITEFPGNKKETVTIVNGSASSHSVSAKSEEKKQEVPIVEKPEQQQQLQQQQQQQQQQPASKMEVKKPVVRSPTSGHSSPDITASENVKSPNKVKKSKSFKNMFGKKKDKKEK